MYHGECLFRIIRDHDDTLIAGISWNPTPVGPCPKHLPSEGISAALCGTQLSPFYRGRNRLLMLTGLRSQDPSLAEPNVDSAPPELSTHALNPVGHPALCLITRVLFETDKSAGCQPREEGRKEDQLGEASVVCSGLIGQSWQKAANVLAPNSPHPRLRGTCP